MYTYVYMHIHLLLDLDVQPEGMKVPSGLADPLVQIPEMLFHSLSSAKGHAQLPSASGTWWEGEVGPVGTSGVPLLGQGGRAEQAQGEHELWEL